MTLLELYTEVGEFLLTYGLYLIWVIIGLILIQSGYCIGLTHKDIWQANVALNFYSHYYN